MPWENKQVLKSELFRSLFTSGGEKMLKQTVNKNKCKALGALTLATAFCSMFVVGAEARELKYSLYVSELHPSIAIAYQPFVDEVKERTNGELTVKLYLNKVLGGTAQQLKIVETGVADFANILPIYTKGRFPLVTVAELPLMFDNAVEATTTMNSVKEQFDDDFNTVKLMDFMITAPSVLLTSEKPLASLVDLQGMNIRASSGANVLTNFGANLVAMPVTDTYLAMERGAVDGTVIPFGSMFSYKFEEVSKYVNPLNLYSVTTANIMNKDTWESLTPEQQKIIQEASDRLALNSAKSQDISTDGAREKIEPLGIEVVAFPEDDMNKLKEKAKPEWDKWVANHSTESHSGAELLESVIAARDAYRAKSN